MAGLQSGGKLHPSDLLINKGHNERYKLQSLLNFIVCENDSLAVAGHITSLIKVDITHAHIASRGTILWRHILFVGK